MIRSVACILFLAIFQSLYAQKQTLEKWAVQNSTKSTAVTAILEHIPTPQDLIVDTIIATKMATHLRGHSTFEGTYVFGSEWIISIKHDNTLLQSRIPKFEQHIRSNNFPKAIDLEKNLPEKQHFKIREIRTNKCFVPTKNGLEPCIQLEYFSETEKHLQLVFDNEYNILQQRDLNRYFAFDADTTVKATVFFPDPLTSAQTNYSGNFADNNDADNVDLTNQLDTVNLVVDNDAGTLYLRNSKVVISEHSLPNVPPASSSGDFTFTRSENQFEDVNVFYHITRQAAFLDSIGYGTLMNYAIPADAHALGGADQSNFSSFIFPPQLNFGEGGVDDAEDADVIIHEYGHAISFACAQNTNNGVERNAIDEGLCDYFAASYSKSISAYHWFDIFNWDGHNEFWDGRTANSNKHYPGDVAGNLYLDAEIWSSTLMEIEADLGREICSQLLIESMFGYFDNMTMPEAAMLYLQADSALYSGLHTTQICNRFNARGILSYCTIGIEEQLTAIDFISIRNSEAFAQRKASLQINCEGSTSTFHLAIFDVMGHKLHQQEIVQGINFVDYQELPSGLLIFTVSGGNLSHPFKLILY